MPTQRRTLSYHPLFALAPLSLTIAATLSLPAQAGEGSAFDLPSVTVTAKGYEADELDTPSATLTLDASRAPASESVGSLFRGQPGTAVHGDGSWGQNPVLRGLKKESIVLQVDGVRLNSAQPQGALASFASLGLLDSIEVVKGPGSVLHGSGALGGAVNLRTPQAEFSDRPSIGGRFSASAGSVDDSLGGGAILTLSNADHALVLGATGRDVGDYDTPTGRVENSGFESSAFLAKYAFRLAEGHRLQLNVQGQEDRNVWYPGSAKQAPNPALGTLTIHSPRQERELYELSYEGEIGPGTLEASLYRQEVLRQIRAWSSGQERNQVWNDVTFTTDGVRAQYRLPLGERHLLTVGAETWEMSGDPQRFQYNPPLSNNAVATSPFRNGVIESRGVFLQDEIMFDDWTLMLGARYDSVTGDADIKGSGPDATTEGLRSESDTLSWSVGAIYNASPMLNPYVSLGSAYRAPDMRERFEDAARGDGYFHVGNPQLDPEQSTNLEIGLKGRSERGEYRLAAFHTRIDDYIAGRITGDTNAQNQPIKRTENLDRIEIQGLEAGFLLPLEGSLAGGHWQLDGSLTWLRGTNKQDDEPLYQMPAHEATLGIGQQPPVGFHWHAQVRGVASQDRTADLFSNGTEPSTPGYATADLGLGWRFGPAAGLSSFEVGLEVNNLFDRTYREHLTDQPEGGELLAPGRGALLSLRGRF
ncbi:TonB-dependent receptor [Billgrantia kenyensis]|uniref:TonB-dependent receptor n=1 Tax=Billgrantia kenyensis TaxID=321266 RepID=A0A7V9W153_9GAMM|nr:TonB-dependent receptor [Halomonas kenyensis]MBA2779052.1 TonB-dependent receptor [Halomonas kenyensis]MCG6660479.1 TonB-dependent receptor [Halomonas kenyensis]